MENIELNSKKWLSLENLVGERWHIIDECPNYAVSDYGRIKRLEHTSEKRQGGETKCLLHFNERIVRLSFSTCGYLCYRPSLGCGRFGRINVHKLVARYFVGNPHGYSYVNHRNEDKSDNRYTNLEWCTAKYNSNYGTCQQRRAETVRNMRRNRSISINQYRKDGEFVRHYSNKGEVDDAGFSLKTILRACNHVIETSQGYVWRFEGDPYTKPSYENSKGGTIKKKVLCFDLNNNFLKQYENLIEAAESIGGKNKRSAICDCCYGNRKQAYGYIWRYKN